VLTTFPAGWVGDWHPAPFRQLYFLLSGAIEVEVSDGEKRRAEAGAIFLVEDLEGRGHITRVEGARDALGAIVHLDGPSIRER
jgi:hypothetical protein